MRWKHTACFAYLSLGLFLVGCAGTATPDPAEQNVRPGINEPFLAEDLDVDHWVGVLEGESREISVRRAAIVQALELKPGMAVADIGAGKGLFLQPFASAVGSGGALYAVDVAPRFLDHLRARAAREGLAQVKVVEGKQRSVELPAASVDMAFVCDTYHHFEYPRATLASLHEAIRRGGVLVVIDFERIPGETADWILEHVRAGKSVFRHEIEAAGFLFEGEVEVEGLEENYVLRFRRP